MSTCSEARLTFRAKAEDRPLRLDCIPRISFGDARKSMRVGVYAVTKPPKTIFGQTTSLGFAARLGDKIYSSAQKVIAHLGGESFEAKVTIRRLTSQTRTSDWVVQTISCSQSMNSPGVNGPGSAKRWRRSA